MGSALEIVKSLVERMHILVILGFIALLLGLSGGISYHEILPFPDILGRVASCAIGVILISLGAIIQKSSTNLPKASDYGIEITHPESDAKVDKPNMKGTIKKLPPDGYCLYAMRVYGDGRLYPVKKIHIQPDGINWQASNCDIGGKPGDYRGLAVYIVGGGGRILIDYYKDAAEIHNVFSGQKDFKPLPLIGDTPTDMILCAKVDLVRLY